MSRYLHHYKTKIEFQKDYYSEDKYKSPWVSYVDRRGRWEPYPVNYNRPGGPLLSPPSHIWIDDFKDPREIAEGSGYDSFENYMADYMADPESFGSNRYTFTSMTFEYNGNMYYLYEGDVNTDTMVKYGLLPTNYSYAYLLNVSMETNYDNRFEPFAYILNSDETKRYESGDGSDYVLVKVENEVNNGV